MRRTPWLGLVLMPLACESLSPDAGPSPPVVLAHPPADPGGPAPDPASAADVSVFAVRTLYFGDVVPATGVVSSVAWKTLGFDIDGKDTTQSSTDVCQLAAGASPRTQEDGNGGIDNSFGTGMLPILVTTFGRDFSSQANASLSTGLVTNLLVVRGLGASTTASPLSASLLVAAPLGATPTWSVADVWPVDSSSLLHSDPGVPLLAFPRSYAVGGVLVAEPPSGSGGIALGVVGSIPLVFPIRHVQVATTLSPDGMTATSGTISGIVPTERLVELGRKVAGRISTSLCDGVAFESIFQQLQQAQDILLDGTQDPSRPCDGISIGLGFEAVRVQAGPPVVVSTLGDVCPSPDAGP